MLIVVIKNILKRNIESFHKSNENNNANTHTNTVYRKAFFNVCTIRSNEMKRPTR